MSARSHVFEYINAKRECLKLRFSSHEVAAAHSLGREPQVLDGSIRQPRSGDSSSATYRLLSPLRGLCVSSDCDPWAYAQGYVLPSLRDCGIGDFKTYVSRLV